MHRIGIIALAVLWAASLPLSPEGIAPLIRKNQLNPAIFESRTMEDLVGGNPRRFMYRRGVLERLIRRIDAILDELLGRRPGNDPGPHPASPAVLPRRWA